MCFNVGVSMSQEGHDRRSLSRRWVAVLATVALVIVVGGMLAALIGPRLLGGTTPVAAMPPPRFVEEALAAGLDHVYDGEYEFFVGGGAAAFDCDDDGRPDLYLAGGTGPPPSSATRARSAARSGSRRSPNPITDLSLVTGAYPLDVDSDGVTDLAVLRRGESVLLRGLGDCRFERANEAWSFDGGNEWTTAFSATWEDGAAWPTLAFGNYVRDDLSDPGNLCQDNALVRPDPGGSAFAGPTPLTPSWCALSMLFSDWDRSGHQDLRVSNDRHYYSDLTDGQEQLWRMRSGQPPHQYTEAEGWQWVRIFGMGIASQDLDGDGKPEVFLSNQGDNKLQTLVKDATGPNYHSVAIDAGVTAHEPYAGGDTGQSTAWHSEFGDVNNDAFMDLFVAKGNIEAMPETAAKDPSNLLIGQPGMTFVEGGEAAGIVDFARARGAALADFNLDGLLDIVEVTRRENVRLWRSVGAGDATAPGLHGPLGGGPPRASRPEPRRHRRG